MASPLTDDVAFQRHGFVSGWFTGDVNFGDGYTYTSSAGRDGFVAIMRQTGPNAGTTDRVTPITGAGDQEALAVSVGPVIWGEFEPIPPNPPVRYFRHDYSVQFMAVAGYFTQELIPSGLPPISASAGEDGFVAIHPLHTIAFSAAISIPGPGHARVLAVAVDPVDTRIVIAGFHSSAATNFDPAGPGTTPLSYSGGNDIFVARYAFDESIGNLRLDWLFTTGTSGDDAATSVAMDSTGRVYATGYKSGQGGTRDIWIAKVDRPADVAFNQDRTTACEWTGAAGGLLYAGPGDDAGLGLAVDGL